MNPETTRLLAELIHTIRPDWDRPGISHALARCGPRPDALVAWAAVYVAANPDARTPAAIPVDGPQWRGPQLDTHRPGMYYPPRRDQACPDHPGEWRDSCRAHRADAIAADR